jgi:hypothetical protein
MINKDKYWSDYTTFLETVSRLTKLSPADLLDFYTEFVESLETKNADSYTRFEYEVDNDFYFRTVIQTILDTREIAGNLLLQEFKNKINSLDKRIKPFLATECATRVDWFKKIKLNPLTYT